tara:strand:+ start:574 stop:1284 length:711 start_codon:yes stop_codon:yes gene_type:complete
MPKLSLSHQGYKLVIEFPSSSFFVETRLTRAGSLYQILFRHLIEGKAVSPTNLIRSIRDPKKRPSKSVIRQAMQRIEEATSQAGMKQRFNRPKHSSKLPPHKVVVRANESKLELTFARKTPLRDARFRVKTVEGKKLPQALTLHEILFSFYVRGIPFSPGALAQSLTTTNKAWTRILPKNRVRTVQRAMREIKKAAAQKPDLQGKGFKVVRKKRIIRKRAPQSKKRATRRHLGPRK